MAYIYGSPGLDQAAANFSGKKDIFLRLALPLLFLFALASAGLHAFQHGSYFITAFFAIFFIILLLRFEELGLTLAMRLSGSAAASRADWVVARTLRLLPDGYHVFHGPSFDGGRMEHAVVGPGGLFLVSTKPHLGTVTAAGESLRLNGWPFLGDPVGRTRRLAAELARCLDPERSGTFGFRPVLCFSRGSVETERFVRGVMVSQASNLVRMILEHDNTLSSEQVLFLADRLAPLVRPAAEGTEASPGEAQAGTEAAASGPAMRRQACGKCRHVPSDLEAELFPGECPRCGRLLTSGPEEATVPFAPGSPRTPVAAMAAACLIVAAGSALLAFQAGLFDPDGTPLPPMAQTEVAADRPQTTAPRTQPDALAAPAPKNPAAPDAGTPQAAPPADAPSTTAAAARTDREAPALPAAAAPATSDAAPACDPVSAPSPGSPAQTRTAEATPENPPRDPSLGTLTIVTARPVTLWLTNDQTARRFGPFETKPRKPLDIVLPKGCYSLVLEDSGRRRQTSVSFLGDSGRLEL